MQACGPAQSWNERGTYLNGHTELLYVVHYYTLQ